jgi:hypothetical protein
VPLAAGLARLQLEGDVRFFLQPIKSWTAALLSLVPDRRRPVRVILSYTPDSAISRWLYPAYLALAGLLLLGRLVVGAENRRAGLIPMGCLAFMLSALLLTWVPCTAGVDDSFGIRALILVPIWRSTGCRPSRPFEYPPGLDAAVCAVRPGHHLSRAARQDRRHS